MRNRRLIFGVISIPLLVAGIIVGLDTAINLISPNIILPWSSLVISLLFTGVFILIGTIFLCLSIRNESLKEKFSRVFVKITFILYCLSVAIVLFSNGTFVRNTNFDDLKVGVFGSINIVPFKTICNYLKCLLQKENMSIVMQNLIGNLIIFAPMGFFLPYILKKTERFLSFSCHTIGILLCIELFQLFTTRGICDVDDIILNYFGALIIWYFCKTRIVKRLLKQLCIEI